MISKIESKIQDFQKRRNIIYALFLLIFIGSSVVFNYVHLSQIAYENTKILNKFIVIGDHREVAYILKEAQISNFTAIRYDSSDKNRTFILPPKLEIYDEPSLLKSLYLDKITVPVQTGIGQDASESITYEFNRFGLAPYAALMWFLILLASIPQVRYMKSQMIEKFKTDLDLEKKAAKSELAHMVRHNLRTPLSALMKLSDDPKLSVHQTESEILKSTIYQINEIINKLDEKKAVSKSPDESQDIYQTLFRSKNQIALTVPKEISFTFKIEDSLFSAKIAHVPFELKSVLSNIINNAAESISGQAGYVHTKAIDKGHSLVITVSDSGCGISPETLPKVFEKNFTQNKANGSGLGLYHAKEFINKWGGTVDIDSEIAHGTTVTITLPIADRKSWYVPRFKIKKDSKIFVLDDQSLAHKLWRVRFQEIGIENPVFHAKTVNDLNKLLESHKNDLSSAVFLFDYDIQEKTSGLDILQTLPSTAIRCLVTGHFDDLKMQAVCEQATIKLLPKSEISNIPFVKV